MKNGKNQDVIFRKFNYKSNWMSEISQILNAVPTDWKDKLKNDSCNIKIKGKNEITVISVVWFDLLGITNMKQTILIHCTFLLLPIFINLI